jgi:hypothetical protein
MEEIGTGVLDCDTEERPHHLDRNLKIFCGSEIPARACAFLSC